MTGRPGYWTTDMNGGSSVPCLACTPCVPLFRTLFYRGGDRRAFRLPGAGGDHFHCTVEPSPGVEKRQLCINHGFLSRCEVKRAKRELLACFSPMLFGATMFRLRFNCVFALMYPLLLTEPPLIIPSTWMIHMSPTTPFTNPGR